MYFCLPSGVWDLIWVMFSGFSLQLEETSALMVRGWGQNEILRKLLAPKAALEQKSQILGDPHYKPHESEHITI